MKLLGKLAWLALVGALGATPAIAIGCAGGTEDLGEDESDLTTKLEASVIKTASAYKAFSIEGGGFGQAGRSMKFLLDNRDEQKRVVHFMNGNFKRDGKTPDFARFHFSFARQALGIGETLDTFNEQTYFAQKKRFYAGTIQTYTIGDSTELTYAVQLYPDDVAKEETILNALEAIKKVFLVPKAKLAFVATGAQQTTATVKDKIKALGFDVMSIEEILGTINFFPLNAGEAFGFLRMFPKDSSELRPTDIPVFDELPLSLSVVAAAVTKTYQDVNSHVNLKSKERGTPNMVLRDADKNALLASNKDKPVHLVVKKDSFTIEPTTEAIIQQKLKERMNRPIQKLGLVNETRLSTYDEMCPALSPRCLDLTAHWGGKAMGLGFLANRGVVGRINQNGSFSKKLGYDISPKGFGIPVQFYRDFVEQNPVLKSKITSLIAKENTGNLSPSERVALATEIQQLFYTGEIPKAHVDEVRAQITAILPGIEELKVRSSSNAEDIPGFDGAGLHDSFSAEPAKQNDPSGACRVVSEGDVVTKLKVKPKTVECGVKAVYASLWNQRAIEERSFARLDHVTSGMGLSIVPAHDTDGEVVANAVVITRAVNTDGVIGYALSVQVDNNLVTNPEPGTAAELTYAILSGDKHPTHFSTAHFATPTKGAAPRKTSVLTEEQMRSIVDIAKQVELAYCRNKPGYYAGDCNFVSLDPDKPNSLDMELKVLDSGHFVLKQVREFNGR